MARSFEVKLNSSGETAAGRGAGANRRNAGAPAVPSYPLVAMARVLVVSNRLPITVRRGEGGLEVERSSGGLATGLQSVHEESGGNWVGWPGFAGGVADDEARTLAERFEALRVTPVRLSADEVHGYYEGYSNGVLWPLFHSLPAQLPLEGGDFDALRSVNQRFADAAAALWREGDLVWVHDYQLMLVPGMLRERLPQAAIGFFLHIPFPAADLFRTLPQREEVLEGLLAADLIGFHTASYMRNFASSVLHVLGADIDVDAVRWQGASGQHRCVPDGRRRARATRRSPRATEVRGSGS